MVLSRGAFHLHSTGKSGKNIIPFHEPWKPDSMAGKQVEVYVGIHTVLGQGFPAKSTYHIPLTSERLRRS